MWREELTFEKEHKAKKHEKKLPMNDASIQ